MSDLKRLAEKNRKIALIEDANIASCWKRSDSIIKSEPHWYQIETLTVKEPWANGVIYSGIDGFDGLIRIKQVVDDYKRKKIPFQWIVGPNSKPANIAEILLKEGMHKAYTCIGMVKSSGSIIKSENKNITVEIVQEHNLDDYVTASIKSWEFSEGIYQQRKIDMLKFLKNKDKSRFFYIARLNGVAVGSGMTFRSDSYGFLKGGAVCPEFRGEGVYRALVAFRLNHLEQLNVPEIFVYALENVTDKLCGELGFHKVCKIIIYQLNF